MKKVCAANLNGLGFTIIFTDKAVKKVINSKIIFEDDSFVDGESGEYKFSGEDDSYILQPSSEAEIMESIQKPGRVINAGSMPSLVIYDMNASVISHMDFF